jgi:hypothetical protein
MICEDNLLIIDKRTKSWSTHLAAVGELDDIL